MRNRGSIDALAVAACMLAIAAAAFSNWHLSPRVPSETYSKVGSSLAERALAVLPKDGRIIVLTRDTETYRQPAMEISLKEFHRVTSKASASVTIHPIQLDPLRPVEVPSGDFYEAIRRAKTNDVIVSFLGPPVLEPQQMAKLAHAKPKIIALCIGGAAEQVNLGVLWKEGLLHTAIVNRPATPKHQRGGGLAFDQLYAVLSEGELSMGPKGR